jgi:homoserine dehydrogenase
MTKMTCEGSEFEEVLKEAQDKGYAEKDPTADIEGYDACRKIAILTSLVCGQQVDYNDIPTEGIHKITATDIQYAKAMGRAIKLLATSQASGDTYFARVAPFLLTPDHPLYHVNDVFNAVYVRGNMLGDGMFYGSGAGKRPTASAVVGDIVELAKNADKNIPITWEAKKLTLADPLQQRYAFFVRTTADRATVEAVFGVVSYVDAGIAGEVGFTTEVMTQQEYEKKAEQLGEVLQMIRLA